MKSFYSKTFDLVVDIGCKRYLTVQKGQLDNYTGPMSQLVNYAGSKGYQKLEISQIITYVLNSPLNLLKYL